MTPRGVKKFRQMRAVFKSIKAGVSIVQACKAANIDPSTLWDWRQKSQRLDNLIYKIVDSRIQIVEDALFKKAAEGNVKACEMFLCNRSGGKWKTTQGINNTIFMQQNADKDKPKDGFGSTPRMVFTSLRDEPGKDEGQISE